MPKPTATRKPVATKTRKQAAIGNARKEAKGEKPSAASERKLATGIHAKEREAAFFSPVHAKKSPPPGRDVKGKVAIGTPNVPGYTNFVDAEKYAAMKDILLAAIPTKAPGVTQGEMFDVVRVKASKARFPGSTDRWWAKCVQLDLETKGVLRRVEGTPLRWHRT